MPPSSSSMASTSSSGSGPAAASGSGVHRRATGDSDDSTTKASRKLANPLQRGSACLSCRKRKMKCDATKPVCRQCVKANRADECEYDEGKQKSRTQILQEKIAKLETRIRELEGPDANLSSFTDPSFFSEMLDNPLDYSPNSGPIPSVDNSPASYLLGLPSPGNSSESGASSSRQHSWPSDNIGTLADDVLTQGVEAGVAGPESLYLQVGMQWWEAEDLAASDRDMLLDIFIPHAKQCGFEVHMPRLRMSLDTPDAPHPALMNAIYLLACHFSASAPLAEHEPHFLARSLRGISVALEHSDRLVNIVQASGLLAVYFFAKARLLEGYYHSSSAARLAVALGLHQIRTPVWRPQDLMNSPGATWNGSPTSSVPLAPPKDSIDLGERILAFWQVFTVDRCWSVATGLPSSLPDDDHPQLHISTVWPCDIYEYENPALQSIDFSSLNMLYAPNPTMPISSSSLALRAKAAAFFERASRIATASQTTRGPSRWEQTAQMEFALSRFASSLPDFITTSGSPHDLFPATKIDLELVVVHTLTLATTIQLHHLQAQKDPQSHDKCMVAARGVTRLIRYLTEFDYPFLDPIVGTCWMCVSDVFIRDGIWNKDMEIPLFGQIGVAQELETVVIALRQLSITFPVAQFQAEKVEQSHSMASPQICL